MKIAVIAILCFMLSGCAPVIFTASGALAPKVAMGVAAAAAAGTLAKSAVDGVSAVEELKAEFQGKTPQKPVATPATAQPAQAAKEIVK